jgi:5'-nucleotidase
MEGMRVLITNDDGVEAPGIRHLALAAAEHGLDVVVAAPAEEASGSSAAIMAVEDEGRIVVKRHSYDGLAADVFGVAASPAFIVILAMRGAFGPPPELVLSGINRGANAGRAVLHSGTVGAALTLAASGGRGMAVSLDLRPATLGLRWDGLDEPRHWETAARAGLDQLPALLAAPPGIVFNVNAPDLPYDQLRGVRRAALGTFGLVQMTVVETGEGYLQTTVQETGAEPEPGTDVALLAAGFVSVTPLRPTAADPDVGIVG